MSNVMINQRRAQTDQVAATDLAALDDLVGEAANMVYRLGKVDRDILIWIRSLLVDKENLQHALDALANGKDGTPDPVTLAWARLLLIAQGFDASAPDRSAPAKAKTPAS